MNETAGEPVFDGAARLYVQYLLVVQEMERAFEQAVDKFLSDVREAINNRSAPLRVDINQTPKYLSWWLIGTKDVQQEVAYVWFEYRKPEIVSPGQLEVTVAIEKEAKPLRPKVETALRQIVLPSTCQRQDEAAYGAIATYIISYGKSAHPIEDVAEALWAILNAIEPCRMN